MDIKNLRKEYNLTQAQLSTLLGIPKRTIEDWDTGKSKCKDYIYELIRFRLAHEQD